MSTPRPGLILFAHGSRDARWAAPFEAVAARIRERRPGVPLQLAFLEQMRPTLAEAAAALVAAGCRKVDVLPMFLGTGGHLRSDLPPMVDALRVAHPGVQWRLQPAIGEHAEVSKAMAVAALSLLPDDEADAGDAT